jgi:hypothetical protein
VTVLLPLEEENVKLGTSFIIPKVSTTTTKTTTSMKVII